MRGFWAPNDCRDFSKSALLNLQDTGLPTRKQEGRFYFWMQILKKKKHLYLLVVSLFSVMKFWNPVVFLWLAYCCQGSLSCPALCKCYTRRAEVVCNEVPLTEYPSEDLPPNTTMVTIQATNITTISERHLNATPLLQELHLNSNHLQHLPANVLRGVPQLHTLDLTENRISELPSDVFSHAPLRNLVLKNNQIEKVNADWIPENSSVTWLDLSENRLQKVPAALLQKMPHLETLDLSDNRLEYMSAKSLERLTKLESLKLQDNKLETLEESTFKNNRNLTFLFLSRNKFNKIPSNLFQGLTELKALALDQNNLSHIPPGSLDQLSTLDKDGLDLTSNPWQCDGKVEYLWRWIQKNKEKMFLPEILVCAQPPALSGRSVMSLTQSELSLQT